MARALQIEFEGALYHGMARGNARADSFLCDEDRQAFIDNLTRVCKRFDRRVWAWSQMTNHNHLPVETLRPTLSKRSARRFRRNSGRPEAWSRLRGRQRTEIRRLPKPAGPEQIR